MPTLENKSIPAFLDEVAAKGAFLSKVHPPIYAVVLQEEGLTNDGRHHLLLLYKQVHDKRGISESLHEFSESLQAYITRARLTACEVGIFLREISQLSKIYPPSSLRSHLYYLEIRYCCFRPYQINIRSQCYRYSGAPSPTARQKS